jgi:diacylglycerol kinase (ATP)
VPVGPAAARRTVWAPEAPYPLGPAKLLRLVLRTQPRSVVSARLVKICVIFNPAARGEKAKHFRDQLASLSAEVTLKPTYAPGTGRPLAAEAGREGFDTIVAAGGDGTLNEVVNGMGDASDGFVKARLAILPLGTINVFARELQIPTGFDAAWKIIRQGKETLLDLPQAEFVVEGQPCRRYFAQLAGAGLDSRAIELVNLGHKKAIGPLAYVVAGFKAMAETKAQIIASAAQTGATGELVLIGNGRYYGGKFTLFPKADLRDGLLDVTVFPRVNWEVLLRSGWGWLTDQLHSSAGCHSFQAESLTLTSSVPVAFELDGDNAGYLPVKFSVQRQALRVVVP